jgi:hypothetical protein
VRSHAWQRRGPFLVILGDGAVVVVVPPCAMLAYGGGLGKPVKLGPLL